MRNPQGQSARIRLRILFAILLLAALPLRAVAAPYAGYVVDARTGEVLYESNADARLHPASLTKMMTLYIAFEAIQNGEISEDTMVTISRNAAAEPPSKLGLKAGQKIQFRYLLRAAAVKSANDAATAIGEALEGSEAAFARRMTRTAKALGMSRSTFRNAHGLTEQGHLSTARDMTTLGRHLFYDYPQYYNMFSRVETDAGIKEVRSSNRRFLGSYNGADGIKTGYTVAAGFNLVASAERGGKRIIATVFGGQSSASRNAKVVELLDLGFRKAPTRVAARPTTPPPYMGKGSDSGPKTITVATSLTRSPVPPSRPAVNPPKEMLVAMQGSILDAIKEANAPADQATPDQPEPAQIASAAVLQAVPVPALRPETGTAPAAQPPAPVAMAENTAESVSVPMSAPRLRPTQIALASVEKSAPAQPQPDTAPEVVTRMSSSGGRYWGITVGRYNSRYQAERELLQTALKELGTLDGALRKVSQTSRGYEANFVGMSQEEAALACRRLQARGTDCTAFGPSS